MKTYPHLFHKLFASPLMLLESVRFGLESELLRHMGLSAGGEIEMASAGPNRPVRAFGQPGQVSESTIEYRKMVQETNASWRVEQIYQTFGNTALVTIAGAIDKHLSDFDQSCYGGCDLADVDQALSLAANDPKIERLVLNVNSPGGSVTGVPETAARVKAMSQTMETRSFIDSMCCSAAYYIASQADVMDASPSAILGSIGVYSAVLDQTRALEMKGMKVNLIKAGKFKAMGASFKALDDDERDLFQAEVDAIYGEFKGAVLGSRPNVADETMQGQTFRGSRAKAAGLCDNLTSDSLDEYLAGLLTPY